ncbi:MULTISPECIES: hypothetical protein [Haematobacter]|uniref:Uncharacterized protein n=1 Tax=Haematobacter massiliensis TaxID=195105 RepID=A0A086Y817_9RHOB|nr:MULTISPECIES: hypothetical protein [Haematobacter]KFI30417.1 hypothetical protein CN97_12665 [Haematobacter massiliensis]OWJ87425.1 hypothetical protein CDV51_06775 [Haematobacter massiliensis]QBJ24880.1 hypothetical protein HmaOT1_11880 [Haematobacter massiliensis]
MLEAYVAAGFDPRSFWGLTMRLYQVHMLGARRRLQSEADARLTQAWLTVALGNQRRLPKLKSLLKRHESQDPELALRSLSARLPKITIEDWRARQRG